MDKPKALVSWSSGKDSAWALNRLLKQGVFEIAGLITSLNAEYNRVAMHAVRRSLLEMQAKELDLPLVTVPLPWPCSNEEYEAIWLRMLLQAKEDLRISHIAFGDLFLEDVRSYRERQLLGTGVAPLFPLWGEPTSDLAEEMILSGVKAIITCVDPKQLSAEFAGREFDRSLLLSLPSTADACGEKGEFHTFVWSSPDFAHPLQVETGEIVEREGFVFADIISIETSDASKEK